LLRQSLFPHLHSSQRRLPRRGPDRLCRWAIIACHMTWVAPTAVLQAMHNVRPPRRDSPPYATARPFATTSTTAHGAPAASAPCGQREATQFLQSRRSGQAISTLHTGPGRSSGKNMQLHDGGDEAEATGPDSAALLAGACKAWRAPSVWWPSRHRLRGHARWGRSADACLPIKQDFRNAAAAGGHGLRQAHDVRVAGARTRTVLPSARSTAGLRTT
jgi:hypothetical protein